LPQFIPKIDGDDPLATILESIAGIVVTIPYLVEGIANPVVITEPHVLADLVAQGRRLIDLPPRLDAGRSGQDRGRGHRTDDHAE